MNKKIILLFLILVIVSADLKKKSLKHSAGKIGFKEDDKD